MACVAEKIIKLYENKFRILHVRGRIATMAPQLTTSLRLFAAGCIGGLSALGSAQEFHTTRILVELKHGHAAPAPGSLRDFSGQVSGTDFDGDTVISFASYSGLLRFLKETEAKDTRKHYRVSGVDFTYHRLDELAPVQLKTMVSEYKAVRLLIDPILAKDAFAQRQLRTGQVKLGYLEALLQITRERAFPFAQIDRQKYAYAHQLRENLMKGRDGGMTARNGDLDVAPAGPGFVDTISNPLFEYMGPRNGSTSNTRIYNSSFFWRPMTGRIGAMAVHPTQPTTIYVGGAGAGVAKTIDDGVTWNHLGQDWAGTGVSSMLISSANHTSSSLVRETITVVTRTVTASCALRTVAKRGLDVRKLSQPRARFLRSWSTPTFRRRCSLD